MWEDNRNHRIDGFAAFSSHPPTPKDRYLSALLSLWDLDIKAGREGASEFQDVRSRTPSNDNMYGLSVESHVNLVYERVSVRGDTRT